MKAMGMVTIMVQNGVKTVESTSGMTFFKELLDEVEDRHRKG